MEDGRWKMEDGRWKMEESAQLTFSPPWNDGDSKHLVQQQSVTAID
ncbi:MAG: hypothetical protein HC786_12410 [Richelia sp. CSU_2_1]|nr:hypothetical protein [Richelia sp. CSU_2_1]NJS42266.1 hypothetical protein [Candidatus Gracilibacteria bacterium]